MSEKNSLKKLIHKMFKIEEKQIKKNLSNYVQPNEKIDFVRILKNKTYHNSIAPIYTKERSINIEKVFFYY